MYNQIILINFIVLFLTACAAQSSLDLGAAPTNAEVLTGTWIGSYTCLQGDTGVTLTLNGHKNGLVEGIFLFYPALSNSNAATGRYIVRGSYFSDGSLILGGGAWIEKPEGYRTVSLKGKVNFEPAPVKRTPGSDILIVSGGSHATYTPSSLYRRFQGSGGRAG